MKKVVYFNHWFSSIATVIDDLKERNSKTIHIIGSSKNSEHAFRNSVDTFLVEDWKEVSGDIEATKNNYIEYLLRICTEYKVDYLFAKKHADWIAERAFDFGCRGVFIVTETVDIHNMMQSKANVYDIIKNNENIGWIVPHYLKTSNKDEIYKVLKETSLNNPWCFKLDNDEGGASFRKIDNDKITIDTLAAFRMNTVSIDEATSMVGYTEPEDLDKLIYMEILDSPEISVDCYNSKKGFIAICREKVPGTRTQRLFYSKELSNICKEIRDTFKLTFPFNAQFRVLHGKDSKNIDNFRLLEINPRMSGGTYYATMFDMNIANVCLNDLMNNQDGYNIEDFIDFDDKFVTYVEKAIKVERK